MTAETDLPPLPERFDCTNGSAQWCYGCYTMTRDDLGDYVLAEDYDALRSASEALQAEVEALRAEVERANSWNERVSVCRDHVADIVDGPCVICALNAAKARAQQLAAVGDLWICGFCHATYRLDALCCDAQREFRAAQRQEPAAVDAGDARDAERYRWLRKALLGADDDPIDHLLLEKEPETEVEFDAAVDAALAAQHQEPPHDRRD